MYADELTDSMQKAISETNRRRKIQMAYNEAHGITPKSIEKEIREDIKATFVEEVVEKYEIEEGQTLQEVIDELTNQMLEHAQRMEFEEAAELRDQIKELEKSLS